MQGSLERGKSGSDVSSLLTQLVYEIGTTWRTKDVAVPLLQATAESAQDALVGSLRYAVCLCKWLLCGTELFGQAVII